VGNRWRGQDVRLVVRGHFRIWHLLLAACLGAGCGPQPLSCGEPTRLEPHPLYQAALPAAPLGPLMVRNFRDGETNAVISEYSPGYATKVVISVARPFDRPLSLSGRRCSDGSRLRFASSYPFALNSTPAPPEIFAAAGEVDPIIEPVTSVRPDALYGVGPAYMLFTSSGKWVLEVRDGNALAGRAVLLVR
jgi:hypothetical protein